MAKRTQHSPHETAAPAEAKGFGRIRQMFSKKKEAPQQPDMPQVPGAAPGMHAAQHGEGHRLKASSLTHAAVGADRAVGRVHGAISRVNSMVYYGSFAAGGLAAMSKLPLIGKAFQSASKLASTPREYMDSTSVRDALHAPSSMVSGLRNKAQGYALKGLDMDAARPDGKLPTEGLKGAQAVAARLANTLGDAHQKFGAAESGVAGALSRGTSKIFDPLGDAVGKMGADKRGKLAERLAGRAGKRHGEALGALDGLIKQGDGKEAFAPLQETLGKAKDMLGDGSKRLGQEEFTALQETLGSAREGLSDLAKGAVDKKTLSGLQKSLKQVEDASGAFHQRSGMADKVRDLPNVIKGAPKSLADANLTNVALKGAVVTGTTLQVTSTARGIAEKVHSLKQMYCDLTGEEKISTRKLLTSKKVPAIVKEARGQIMKEFGPRVVLNFANTIATYGFMKNNNKKTMLLSGGLMALSQLHSAKVQSYELLPMYEALNQSPQIQDMQYAAFISAASKDAAKAGGIESALVQALAVDYAQEGVRPADILKEIENGRFDERALEKAQANRALMERQGGHALAPTEKQADHGAPTPSREVMGAHTQRLQSEMARRQSEASQLR